MNCPKCNATISDNSRFCTYCGAKIEKSVESVPVAESAVVCKKCGATLKPGVKFCSKCGAIQSVQPEQSAPQTVSQPEQSASQTVSQPEQSAPQTVSQPEQSASQTVSQPEQSAPQAVTQQPEQSAPQAESQPTQILAQRANEEPQTASQPTQSTPQQAPPSKPADKQTGNARPVQQKKSAKKGMLPVIIVLIIVFIITFAASGYLVLRNVFDVDLVAMITGGEEDEEEDEESTADADEDDEDESDSLASEDEQEQNAEEKKGDPELLNALDGQVAAARKAYDEMSYVTATSESIDIIYQYVTIGEENNLTEEAEEKIQDVFDIASKATIESCKGIENQGIGSAGFEQVTSMLNRVLDVASFLSENGYTINSSEIMEYNNGVTQRFKDTFIRQINEITEREQWSRDEAWTYAEQAYSIQKDGKVLLFDESNPDDPLRLRYAYCLAWITRKRCENGVADGSMTNEDAFNAAVAILEETDYNLLVLQDIMAYGNAAGKDVSKYQAAYNAIIQELKDEQNLSIVNSGVNSATSVDIRKFWYFNDLDGDDTYKVDVNNGTTQATRDWIRNNIPSYIYR